MNKICTEPWKAVTIEDNLALHKELSSEISEEHVLHGLLFDVVAWRPDKNQVLIELFGAVFDWAVVSLTGRGAVVSDELPDVDFYITREEWVDRCMKCPWC